MPNDRYVLDQGRRYNPTALAPNPYKHQVGWPAQLLTPNSSTYVRPGSELTRTGQLGQDAPTTPDNSALIKGLLLLAAAFILWKIITPGVKGNPPGKNKVATVFKGAGGWYYKLARKKARRRGPFHDLCAATEAAHAKGYSVVED
jgi:hypothetical protein